MATKPKEPKPQWQLLAEVDDESEHYQRGVTFSLIPPSGGTGIPLRHVGFLREQTANPEISYKDAVTRARKRALSVLAQINLGLDQEVPSL